MFKRSLNKQEHLRHCLQTPKIADFRASKVGSIVGLSLSVIGIRGPDKGGYLFDGNCEQANAYKASLPGT
jgi:hypothetical protein